MGALNVRRTLPEQLECFDGVTQYHPEFNAHDTPVFALFNRLHVLPAWLRAFTRRGAPDALVFRDLAIDFDHRLIDTPPAV
jgi:hypothetical protein